MALRTDLTDPMDGWTTDDEATDTVLYAGTDDPAELAAQAPQSTWGREQSEKSTELGHAEHEGLECSLRQWTHTIPASTFGSPEPIEIKAEVWTTDAFGFDLVVKTVVDNPFSGTTTVELRNIQRRTTDELTELMVPDPAWRILDDSAVSSGVIHTVR